MRASKELRRSKELMVRALPSLDAIRKSIGRVFQRWPHALRSPHLQEREEIAQDMIRRVTEWDWNDVNTQQATSAAVAVFDAERCEREDLSRVRDFFHTEIAASQPGAFLDAMVLVYIESFSADSSHSQRMASSLKVRIDDVGPRHSKLFTAAPNVLHPATAAHSLAAIMLDSEDPFIAMKKIGLQNPHGPGLMQDVHLAFIKGIAQKLGRAEERQRLFNWLVPKSGSVLTVGATPAIEALLAVWKNEVPSESLRKELSETIVSAYKDPRLHRGGIWSDFDPNLKQILLRWLTSQHLEYFCGMVTATQDSHMWGPRRDFWLQLDEDKRIDEAWVAFGASASQYAKKIISRGDHQSRGRQFGRQLDRGGSTSLLIMRIGNKIVVDGCHSYKTHIFRDDDPYAPKLYQPNYYCDVIMRRSNNSKPHNSIPIWKRWVEQNV